MESGQRQSVQRHRVLRATVFALGLSFAVQCWAPSMAHSSALRRNPVLPLKPPKPWKPNGWHEAEPNGSAWRRLNLYPRLPPSPFREDWSTKLNKLGKQPGVESQESQRDRILTAISRGKTAELDIVEGNGDPNAAQVQLRNVPMWVSSGAPPTSSLAGIPRVFARWRFVPPARISLKELLASAIERQDVQSIRALDGMVLRLRDPILEDSARWVAPMRLFEYSAGNRTLTVKPPEPLKEFTIRLGSDEEPIDLTSQSMLRQFRLTAKVSVRNGGDPFPPSVATRLGIPMVPQITRSPRSANSTYPDLEKAARLGQEIFGARSSVVFDGLPDPPVGPWGMWQLFRMNQKIFSGGDWRGLRKSLDLASMGPRSELRKMQPRSLMDELRSGNSNLLVLIAHNARGKIYTRDGELSIADMEKLKRDNTPERAIVLITCEAGGVGGPAASMAETLLGNRLAAAVFASPKVVDAAELPKLLADLKVKPLGEALASHQIEHLVSIARSTHA